MPVSIVVGGQFGSEGKGKVSLERVRRARGPTTVIRVGGPNSGHTGYDRSGRRWALRQLPAGAIDGKSEIVFPAGSYIDIPLLVSEISELGIAPELVRISEFARIITPEHKAWEMQAGLAGAIGSTGSGVGGAVMASVARQATNFNLAAVFARDVPSLHSFIVDIPALLHRRLSDSARVVIEGTQGLGLSLLDGLDWPKATARTTSAAGALAEAGLSPLDVDEIILVIRSYPIRVAGDSGPLLNEISWTEIARRAGIDKDISEYTTVTKKLRRVGEFDASMVRRAIATNRPTDIVLNHVDYLFDQKAILEGDAEVQQYIVHVESEIGQRLTWLGYSPQAVVSRSGVVVA